MYSEILSAFTDVPPIRIIAGDTPPTIFFDVDSQALSSLNATLMIANKDTPHIVFDTVSCNRTATGFQCIIPSEVTQELNGTYWYYLSLINRNSNQEFRRVRGTLEVCAAPKVIT